MGKKYIRVPAHVRSLPKKGSEPPSPKGRDVVVDIMGVPIEPLNTRSPIRPRRQG